MIEVSNDNLYTTILYSTLPHPTQLYYTILYSTLLCSTILTLLYPTLLYLTLLCSTILYTTLPYSTLLYPYHTTLIKNILSFLPTRLNPITLLYAFLYGDRMVIIHYFMPVSSNYGMLRKHFYLLEQILT